MRLTKKNENGFYELENGNEIYGEENGIRLVQIVGEYEDAKEDLGADLITIYKALKNGIYIRDHLGFIRKKYVRLDVDEGLLLFVSPDDSSGLGKNICDYGFSWALTKEALWRKTE